VLPNSQRINRGGLVLPELVETCRNHGFTDVVILHEHRGEPGEGHLQCVAALAGLGQGQVVITLLLLGLCCWLCCWLCLFSPPPHPTPADGTVVC
jgi:hypothetical protein